MKLKMMALAARSRRSRSAPARRSAQISGNVIKIGVLNDMSGLYADTRRPGLGARREDGGRGFQAKAAKGMKVEVISADHQNKPDVGSQHRATSGIDVDKVDVIVDVPNSGVALAVNQIAQRQEQGRSSSPARRRSDLTGTAVLAEHRALDLRHLDARQRHRQGDREDRRRHLVLPHRRLRLRPRARARHRGGRR